MHASWREGYSIRGARIAKPVSCRSLRSVARGRHGLISKLLSSASFLVLLGGASAGAARASSPALGFDPLRGPPYPRVATLDWGGGVAGSSASDNSETDPLAGSCGHPFPRTAFLTFGGSTGDWLEKFDIVLSREGRKAQTPVWLPMRDFNRAHEFAPDFPEEWYLHDGNGDRINLYELDGSWWSNLSDLGGRYTGTVAGIPANNERLIDWYPKYLKAFVDSRQGDGIASDGLYYRLHFEYHPFANVDLDTNGLNDMAESGKGNGWFIQHWTAGVDIFLSGLRSLLGPDAFMIINTGSPDMDDYPKLNGLYYENSAGESNWDYSRSRYFAGKNAVDQPPAFVTGLEVDGYDNQRTNPSKNYYRYMRFGLTRAMLLDRYYELQDLESAGDHYWSKFYDEFDLDVGCPTGDMQEIKNGVWVRFFDEGAAILNVQSSPSTVTSAELATLNGYDGPYYHFR